MYSVTAKIEKREEKVLHYSLLNNECFKVIWSLNTNEHKCGTNVNFLKLETFLKINSLAKVLNI